MQKDIRHKWHFHYSPELIWEALTDPAQLGQWFMENDFKPVVGHRFRFTTKPRVKVGFDGIVYGEVLEVIPCKRLSYSWKGGPGKGNITLDSVVTWTLTEKDNGTELLLEHTGFKGLHNYIPYLIMNKGWKVNVGKKLNGFIKQLEHETASH
jgi:uncharacterized protein YndB with AHSA1/START domain